MDFTDPKVIIVAYALSNLIALIVLWCSWKKPNIARLLFFLLFVWASWANSSTVLRTPEVYLEYADFTFLPFYKDFILGFFSRYIQPFVLSIAACQFLIGISMLLKGWVFKLGAIGGILFFVGIAPLGVGSAFPCSIIGALGLYLIYRANIDGFLWRTLGQNNKLFNIS